MILSPTQCAEFRKIRSALMDYASAEGYRGAAWLNPHLISRFVVSNPAGLPSESLERAGLWRHGVRGPFFVMRHTDSCSMFMNAQGTFAVRGTNYELRRLVPKTPTLVEATLVPFDGLIVCANDPVFTWDDLGEADRLEIDATYRQIVEKGVVYSASALIRAMQRPTGERGRPRAGTSGHAPDEHPSPDGGDAAAPSPAVGESADDALSIPAGLAQVIAFKPRDTTRATLS